MTIQDYLFSVVKIVEGAANLDHEKVVAYANQLAGQLRDHGETESAKRLDQALSKSKAKHLSLARAGSASGSLPVDAESRLAVADEEHWKPGQVGLFLTAEQQKDMDRFLAIVNASGQLMASGVGVSASMLVYGPPGCGKTQLARYVAAELDLPLLTARSDALISSYLGSTAKNVRLLFEHAASRPCVLFLDEFDALAKMRDDSRELGELKRVVISLLQNIDALGHDHVLIAATNHEHLLDPAIWRRFAYHIRLAEPDESSRSRMLRAFLGKFATAEQVRLFAAISDGITGARLKQIVQDAIRDAVLDSRQTVDSRSVTLAIVKHFDAAAAAMSIDDQIRFVNRRSPNVPQTLLAQAFAVSQSNISKVLHNRKAKHG